ncbi:hypothetical protein GCM10010277_63780 [Streptomyces longisporoflavus]|nr:hypothetical protein GCM10010277_63780 [Streptomyces longisporoflavus]
MVLDPAGSRSRVWALCAAREWPTDRFPQYEMVVGCPRHLRRCATLLEIPGPRGPGLRLDVPFWWRRYETGHGTQHFGQVYRVTEGASAAVTSGVRYSPLRRSRTRSTTSAYRASAPYRVGW